MSEPKKCGCGRSNTGFCTGLHKLTKEEWQEQQKAETQQEQKQEQKQ